MVPSSLVVEWPDIFYSFLDIFDVLNFDFFGFVSYDCVVGRRSFLVISSYTSPSTSP